MGCFLSLCRKGAKEDIFDQYENLVVSKPAPISLESIRQDSSEDTDVPLFAPADSGSDGGAIPKVEEKSDEELDFQAPQRAPSGRSRKHD